MKIGMNMLLWTDDVTAEEQLPLFELIAGVESCADVLAYVHVSENDRSTPGAGQVAWDETFATLRDVGYDGWFTVEAFGASLPSIASATKIWRRMFETEEQLARDAHAFVAERALGGATHVER